MNSRPTPNASHEAIREFLIETQESLEQVEMELVKLERSPPDSEGVPAGVSRMFRILHSIKGACGFLGYPKLAELSHVGENLLGRIRGGLLPIDGTVITALLSVVDAIREVLDHIEAEQNEGDQDYTNLTQHLSQILGSDELADDSRPALDQRASKSVNNSFVVGDLSGRSETPSAQSSSQLSSQTSSQFASNYSSQLDSPSKGEPSEPRTPSAGTKSGKVADSTARVDVALLDQMMMLAGELVLTRNQILQDKSLDRDGRLNVVFRQLNSITSELQGCIMKSRMQPIAKIWTQIPRMVRDVALGAFKQVLLTMEGEETELDKTIIDAIRDPLTHVLRNSVDHGIELPELRTALGKPPEGRIWMRAYHAGGQVNIEIEDDGAGIDVQAIRRKALEQNLLPPAQVDQMSSHQLLGLIFQPGFSTAGKVTELSGRGVGLDVVKSNIERMGGAIHVKSVVGEGTTLTLRIPLTLAIVQALVVQTEGDFYVVPQSRIVELIRLRGEDAQAVFDAPNGIPDFRFRGRLLPIMHLREELELGPPEQAPQDVNLVVLRVHDRHLGLVVDRIVDNQEVVIKPLWQPLRNIPTYAGATQLADGAVALILDPVGLAKRAGLAERSEAKTDRCDAEEDQDDGETVLLTNFESGETFALETQRLQRIDEVHQSQIQNVSGQDMLEHNGEIVRLFDLAALLGLGRHHQRRPAQGSDPSGTALRTNAEPLQSERNHVAFYGVDDETIGFTIGPVVDIVEHKSDVRGMPIRSCVEFVSVIGEKVVEFVDLDRLLQCLEVAQINDAAIASPEE